MNKTSEEYIILFNLIFLCIKTELVKNSLKTQVSQFLHNSFWANCTGSLNTSFNQPYMVLYFMTIRNLGSEYWYRSWCILLYKLGKTWLWTHFSEKNQEITFQLASLKMQKKIPHNIQEGICSLPNCSNSGAVWE